MDYFIDDMVGSFRKGSTKSQSNSTSPAPSEPPLPPFPMPTRSKKNKSVKPRERSSSASAGSSKVPEASTAATIPLPDTPAPSIVTSQADASAFQATLLSPKSPPASAVGAESDYFSVAELASPRNALAGLRVPEPPTRTTSAFFTPMSEFPPVAPELSQPVQEPAAAVEQVVVPAAGAEPKETALQPEEQSSAAKEIPEDRVESSPPVLNLVHTSVPVVHSPPAIMIGLSGGPASGKTTLAHVLSAVLPPTTPSFIIHQDDFLVRKHLLIPGTDGELDVDYRRTVDFSAFKRLIDYSKREGKLPPRLRSLQPEDWPERALSRISPESIEHIRASLADLPSLRDGRPVGIVDGSLLYHSKTIRNLLDIKILLRASKEVSRTRYCDDAHDVDEGSSKDGHPWASVDYFDRVLWPNYVEEHAVLFEDRVVDGRPVSDLCEGLGISVQPRLDMNVEEVLLQWVVDILRRDCEEAAGRHEREVASAVEWKAELEFCKCNAGLLGKIRQTIFDLI